MIETQPQALNAAVMQPDTAVTNHTIQQLRFRHLHFITCHDLHGTGTGTGTGSTDRHVG